MCRRCNNEWGGAIENAMQRSFVSIYLKNRAPTNDDVVAISRWMFLKLCLYRRAYQINQLAGLGFEEGQASWANGIRSGQRQRLSFDFRATNSVPANYHFFICQGLPPLHYGTFNYVPEDFFLTRSDKIEGVGGMETCLFAVGEFQSIVTSDPILSYKLNSARTGHTNEKVVHKLQLDEAIEQLRTPVHFLNVEDYVLSHLDRGNEKKLRRSTAQWRDATWRWQWTGWKAGLAALRKTV